jgi:hypothetical protein
MSYVEEDEKNLLKVCGDAATTNASRGRHFELMFVRRCVKLGVAFPLGDANNTIPATRTGARAIIFPSKLSSSD